MGKFMKVETGPCFNTYFNTLPCENAPAQDLFMAKPTRGCQRKGPRLANKNLNLKRTSKRARLTLRAYQWLRS